MDSSCIPKCMLVCRPEGGKRTQGGQKRRWADDITADLKKCGLHLDWRKLVQDRAQWRGMVRAAAEDVNEELEASEKARKDERKQRREGVTAAQNRWPCCEPGCAFVAQSKAGLVNHTRQKHTTAAQRQLKCTFCGGLFRRQGLAMHQKYCVNNPERSGPRPSV